MSISTSTLKQTSNQDSGFSFPQNELLALEAVESKIHDTMAQNTLLQTNIGEDFASNQNVMSQATTDVAQDLNNLHGMVADLGKVVAKWEKAGEVTGIVAGVLGVAAFITSGVLTVLVPPVGAALDAALAGTVGTVIGAVAAASAGGATIGAGVCGIGNGITSLNLSNETMAVGNISADQIEIQGNQQELQSGNDWMGGQISFAMQRLTGLGSSVNSDIFSYGEGVAAAAMKISNAF